MKLGKVLRGTLLTLPLAQWTVSAEDLFQITDGPASYGQVTQAGLDAELAGLRRAASSGNLDDMHQAIGRQSRHMHRAAAIAKPVARVKKPSAAVQQPAADPVIHEPALTPVEQAQAEPATPAATPVMTSQNLAACGDISQSGQYTLTGDVTATKGSCFTFKNVSHVTLNCAGHKISATQLNVVDGAISIDGSSDITLQNCDVTGSFADGPGGESNALVATNSKGLTILNSHLRIARLTGIEGGLIQDSTISGYYEQRQSNHIVADHDQFLGFSDRLVSATYLSNGGTGNVLRNSLLDGGWDGQSSTIRNKGSDVVISLTEESDMTIEGNDIKNSWGLNLETIGLFSGSTIQGNHFSMSSLGAIGAGWETSWEDVQVLNNDASNVPMLFNIQHSRNPAKDPATNVIVRFDNNSFIGNSLLSRAYAGGLTPSSSIDFINLPPASIEQRSAVIVGNNVFKNNNFGADNPAPVFNLPADPVNAGGNVCRTPFPGSSNPLSCGSTTTTASDARSAILSLSRSSPRGLFYQPPAAPLQR